MGQVDKMVKACIFDLDGTIADTVESIARAVNRTLVSYGFSPHPVEAYNYYAGDGMNMCMKRALAAAGDTEGKYLEEAIVRVRKWFAEDPLYHAKPYDGMVEVLENLKKRGIAIAVFSNKPHLQAVEVVQTLFGKGFFTAVQGQTDTIPRKPAPDGALAIAKKLGVSPAECLYFGDTNTDMDTGHAAGMFTVGVTWGFRPREELIAHQAMALLDAPADILKIVEERI